MSSTTGADFMRLTSREALSASPQELGVPQPPLQLPVPQGAQQISLPKPADLHMPSLDLRQALEQRASVRKYSDQPLSLEELSYLLWCTQGVKSVTTRPITLRTVPSAGARHAFETYVLVNRVNGLEPGLYRFMAIEHALVAVDLSDAIATFLTDACYGQKMVNSAAVTFFWVAVAERMTWRYVERGYRYLHLDAGHVCQNLYLAGESIQCGTCAIAAFDDKLVNQCLGLDGEQQFIIYLASLGKKI